MGQNIGIRKIDERGKVLEESDINFVDIKLALFEIRSYTNFQKQYPWISTIDDYGDTYFNILQRPIVIEEFKRAIKEVKEDEIKKIVVRLISFIEGADTHQYIVFIGD
jgi:hypothetical protein